MLDAYIKNQPGLVLSDNKLVSTEHITTGSIIFVQPPLASVPLPAKRHQRCNYCLRRSQLQCCSRCRSAYFCSNECFRNAWLHFHRILCEPQETDIYKDVDADRWLLERTALTLHSHERLNKQQSHSPPHMPFAIHALQSQTPTVESSADQSIVEAVAHLLDTFGCPISPDELSTLWKRIQMCRFPIYDSEQRLEQVAVGVYPITPLYISHSCRPNCALVYKQDVQYLMAIQDISPGEPLSITYVDLVSSKEQRTLDLQTQFGPDYMCHCIRCEGELSVLDEILDRPDTMTESEASQFMDLTLQSWSVLEMAKVSEEEDKARSPRQVLDPPEFVRYVSRLAVPEIYFAATDSQKHLHRPHHRDDRVKLVRALNRLNNVPHIPSLSLSTIHAAENILQEQIAHSQWVGASRCALYLYVVYRLFYPPMHPKLAYHSLILARSGWNALIEMELVGIGKKLERIYANGTRTWIELARESIYTVFGKDTNLWRDVIELEWVYNREQKVKGAI
ncbi:hypothetical protein BDB01DRAFT_799448 [Pilobolus umbonatus]|nr:hypothetical protein BDB01DRAFT_799448 [Pilobolus umbonatus]